MRIEHIALWTDDIERCVRFYEQYFCARAADPYRNEAKGFESRFLSFASGARIEVMSTTKLQLARLESGTQRIGFTHVAIAVGSEQTVDALTERLRLDGVPILDGPRRTGDGYYESVALDPDGNRLEITV